MKKIIAFVLVALLVVAGAGLLQKRKKQLAKATPAVVLPVVTHGVKIDRKHVVLTLPAMGVVASELSSTLSTKISGRVTEILKQEGDIVQQGELLARIDAADLIARKEGVSLKRATLDFEIAAKREDLKALHTALASAQETHQRTLELMKVKGASVEQSRQEEAAIAQIESKISAAENGIASLEKNKAILRENEKEIQSLMSYTDIIAPICGTVSQRQVKVGDLAMPGQPLFRISACSGQYLNLSLPSTIQADRAIWNKQPLALSAKNQATPTGLAQYVAPLPKDSQTVEGQFIAIQLVIYEGDGILLPMDSLLTMDGRTSVFVWEQGKAVKTPVTVIARGSEGIVVAQELNGRTVLTAKPDILLRAASGAPLKVVAGSERDSEG